MKTDSLTRQLMIGISLSYFLIAILHFVGPLFGPDAFVYFGANYLARLAASGSVIPIVAGIVIGILFTAFGLMCLSMIGYSKPQKLFITILWIVGIVLILRGLVIIPQVLMLMRGTSSFARGPLFSIISLVIGIFQLFALRRNTKHD